MSMNIAATGAGRGKKPSPSPKNSPTKGATSPTSANKTKTETSKRGNTLPTPTIDKYLIKGPAAVGCKRTNNNDSKSKNSADIKLEEKAEGSRTQVPVSNSSNKESRSATEEDCVVIDVDDTDSVSATKQNGSEQEKLSTPDSKDKHNSKKVNEENQLLSETGNGKQKAEQKESKDLKWKADSQGDEGSTDDVESENEAETQQYEINSTEDARLYVNYKEEDFNTDTDFDNSDLEELQEESKRSGEDKGVKHTGVRGSKKRNTAMGSFISKMRKKEKCQGSSSEEEDDRPWRAGASIRAERPRPASNPYPTRSLRLSPLKRQWSDRDTQQYRAGYPDKKDYPHLNMNLDFYQGKIRSKPDGALIDDFHRDWWHNHDRLESHHGYIQWLFPIRESGMNSHAQELQLHEAEAIRNDPRAMKRFKKSYEMMLYFYGIKLVNSDTGEVDRADNWQPRFKHLNHSMHNYLRITRILKCLGEMGLEHFKTPFLNFMIHEAAITRRLDRTLDSCCNYWIGTIRSDRDRERLKKFAEDASRGSSSRY